MSDIYLSNIIKNVNVPAGVPIRPNQAFVNAMNTMILGFGGPGIFDWSYSGIVSINDAGGIMTNFLNYIFNNAGTYIYTFEGNQISDPANIDLLLGIFVAVGVNGRTINISGGTNAPPPPAQVHLDEIFTLTIPATPASGLAFTITYALGASTIIFDNTINLSASSNDGGGNITVGMLDSQTAIVRSAKIVALWGTPSGSTAGDNGDGSFTVTDPTESNYPYFFSDAGSGITYVENQAGQALAQNANLLAAIANGNVVYYNYPLPRNTALPALSGAVPPYNSLPLTCSNGTWLYSTGYAYQWQTSTDGLTGWANIGGATSDTYAPDNGDIGNYLRCIVTGSNATGSASASSFHTEAVIQYPIRVGLIAEYMFKSGSELVDTSGNGNTLTNINGVTFSGGVATTVGNNAITTSSILISPATNDGLAAGTYTCIVNNISAGIGIGALFADGAAAGPWASGNVTWEWARSGSDIIHTAMIQSGNTIPSTALSNTQHYIVLRMNGDGTFDAWIDGVNIGSALTSPFSAIVGNGILIGTFDHIFDGACNCDFQKFRVWNRALTNAEIAILAGGY